MLLCTLTFDFAGAPTTNFSNNNSTLCGGDVTAVEGASVDMNSARLFGSTSGQGGSLCVGDTAWLSVSDSVIIGGRSTTGAGGCMAGAGLARIQLLRTNVSGCSAVSSGGGIIMDGQAILQLFYSTVSNNSAGTGLGGTLDGSSKAHGGGVSVADRSSIVLQGSVLSGNKAPYGAGGMFLSSNATVSFAGDSPTATRRHQSAEVSGWRLAFPRPICPGF
jgi:hypothetical protein